MKTNKIVKDNHSRSCTIIGTKPSTSGECPNSRRKLEFKNKLPLEGKRIYLDLRGLKQRNVEDSLSKFGAIVEKFLSKEIHYFVTDQSKIKEKNDDQNTSGSPSVYVSSPFNSGQTPSPSTFDKRALSVTRGKAMLQCVKIESTPENIVDKARKLGVKIVPYTSLMKWISKEKTLLETTKSTALTATASASVKTKAEDNQKKRKTGKLKYLKKPCIKFEAVNKHYRPVVMEFTSWPHVNLSSAAGSCPFDEWLNCVSTTKIQPGNKVEANVPVTWSAESGAPQNAASNLTHNNNTKKSTVSQQIVSQKFPGRRLLNWERRKLTEKKLRQGFCECCDVRFDDIKKHLTSTEHCAFMKNENNYKQLDKLIARGKAIHQFVENVVSDVQSYSYDNSHEDYEFSEPSEKVLLMSLKNSSAVNSKVDKQSENHCSSSTVHSPPSSGVFKNVPPRKQLVTESDAQLLELDIRTAPVNIVSPKATKMSPDKCLKSPTRSPFKCLFNSPSRLDPHYDKSSPCNKLAKERGISVSEITNKVEPLLSPSKPFESPNKIKRHISVLQNNTLLDYIAPSKSLKNSEQEKHKAYLNSLPPQLEKFPILKCNKAPKSEKYVVGEQQKTERSPPVLERWDKLAANSSTENSPNNNHAGVQMKRTFRSSSHNKSRSKRRRLFKLGEKWQVLSQQSVKKILFCDESPESFVGFHPQEIFKNDYSSDISFETVSEVFLTDHSDFEWTLGNSDGPFSEPSSQAAGASQTFVPQDSIREGYPSSEPLVHHSPDIGKKSTLSAQVPKGGSTYISPHTGSVSESKLTAVSNTQHSFSEDSLGKPETTASELNLCNEPVKNSTDASFQHTTPITIPVHNFPNPLIQDIEFSTQLNFQNLDSVASTVCNFDIVESSFPPSLPTTSVNTYSGLPSTDIDCLPNSAAISTVQSFQIFSPLFSCENSELPAIPSVPDQVQLPQQVSEYKPPEQNISVDSQGAVDFQNCLPPDLPSVHKQRCTTSASLQPDEAQLPLNSTVIYDPLPVLNFESSFNLPVQNFEMLPSLVTAVAVNTTFSPLSTILTAPLTAEASISPDLPLQSQCDSTPDDEPDDNDVVIISDTSVPLPDCLSDNKEETLDVKNANHQHSSVQMVELASSSQFDSSAGSEANQLTSEQRAISPVVGFVSLSNFATSRVEDCGLSGRHDIRIQPSILSHSMESSSKSAKPVVQKCKPNKILCGFVTSCEDQGSKQTIDTDPIPIVTQCMLLSDYKSSQYISACSSDSQTSNSASVSKSESDTTDSLVKLTVENTDASDETLTTSDWNVLKNDSYAEIKDSGFLSIEELTPKKSPLLIDSKSSGFSKKFAKLAKPCSVVLEKTDLFLADKQNIFSVKRADNTITKSPEMVSKPRLLKRLSDTHKTFRLDYIHGNTNRKFSPRSFTHKTRCK